MIKSAIKRFGFLGAIENIVIHCLQTIGLNFSLMEIFAHDLSDNCEFSSRNDVRILQFSDFESQANINPLWFTPQKIEDMKSAFNLAGNIAVGLVDKEMIIAYGWLSLKTFGLEDITLKEYDGYLWDDYTHPNYRGQGLHSIINQARIALLYLKGKKRVLTQVAHYNRASRVGYIRNNFKLISRYFQIKIGNFKYTSFKYNKEKK